MKCNKKSKFVVFLLKFQLLILLMILPLADWSKKVVKYVDDVTHKSSSIACFSIFGIQDSISV